VSLIHFLLVDAATMAISADARLLVARIHALMKAVCLLNTMLLLPMFAHGLRMACTGRIVAFLDAHEVRLF